MPTAPESWIILTLKAVRLTSRLLDFEVIEELESILEQTLSLDAIVAGIRRLPDSPERTECLKAWREASESASAYKSAELN